MAPTGAALQWPPGDSGMARLVRRHDWALTPLGPLARWPQSLRTAVDILLGSAQAMQLAWGPARTVLYNDACAPMLGARHPGALGLPFHQAWPDIWPEIAPLVERVFAGETIRFEEMPLVMTRHGYPEETRWTFSSSPVRDESGAVAGLLNVTVEATDKVRGAGAERALREGEALFRNVLNGMDEAFGFMDRDFRILAFNDAALRLGTRPREEILGRSPWELYPGSETGEVGRLLKRAMAGRTPVSLEHRHTWGNGITRWLEMRAFPVNGGLAVFWRDISERKAAEERLRDSEARQAFLLKLGDALRAQTGTSSLIETAARLLGGHLAASRILLAEFDEARGVADIFHGWFADGARPFPSVMRLEDYEGPILDDLRTGRTVRIEDTGDPALARPDLAALADLGVKALLSVPLIVGGRLVVNLSVHQHAARAWTDDDVALVQEVAERLWADLVRARAEAALRASEARLQNVLRIQTVGVLFWGKGFDLVDMNEAFLRMTGFTRAEALGRSWTDLTPPEFHDASRRAIEEVLTRGENTPYEKQYIRKDGSRWWGLFAARRIGGEFVEFVLDITERREAEERLRESEEHFRTIVDAARDYAIFTTDAEGRIKTWPSGARAVFGWSAEEAIGQPADITFTPEDREGGEPAKERREARRSGQAPDVRWHQRRDGRRVFIEGMVRPLTTADGTVTGFLKVGQDVTARRATEAALRESEARFRHFAEASADLLWIRDAESLAYEYLSPAFETIYGTPVAEVLGGNHVRRWAEMILPEDRERVLETIRRVHDGETVIHSFRIGRGDGQIRWIRNTDFPLFDAEGRVQRIGGIAHDATDEVELQDRLQVLVAELQHRSRNLVGVVRAITERTLATSDTLEGFRDRFRPRLEALGRVNGLLSRLEEGDRITFDQLLQTELAAHGVGDGEGHGSPVTLRGPGGIRLRSATVQTFALALHELTTNALKYGALSRPGGRLDVTWRLVPGRPVPGQGAERRLRVDWHEAGPQGAGAPPGLVDGHPLAGRRGYGRELIERALPYQLKAETVYDLSPGGVRCTIIVPVSSTLDLAFSSEGDPDA